MRVVWKSFGQITVYVTLSDAFINELKKKKLKVSRCIKANIYSEQNRTVYNVLYSVDWMKNVAANWSKLITFKTLGTALG